MTPACFFGMKMAGLPPGKPATKVTSAMADHTESAALPSTPVEPGHLLDAFLGPGEAERFRRGRAQRELQETMRYRRLALELDDSSQSDLRELLPLIRQMMQQEIAVKLQAAIAEEGLRLA